MRVFNGLGINRGIASGTIFHYRPTHGEEPRFDLLVNQKEVLKDAIERSVADLEKDVAASDPSHDDAVRMVFESHKLMAGDPILLEDAHARIEAGESAYRAYRGAADHVISKFSALANPYMRNRVIDIIDATDRVLHALVAAQYEREFDFSTPHIIVMDQMRPSVIRNCHKPHVVGFITETGAYDQHSSMIARVMNIPGVIVPGIINALHDDAFVTIDGSAGTVVIDEPRN